jgi:hypothetical protein
MFKDASCYEHAVADFRASWLRQAAMAFHYASSARPLAALKKQKKRLKKKLLPLENQKR